MTDEQLVAYAAVLGRSPIFSALQSFDAQLLLDAGEVGVGRELEVLLDDAQRLPPERGLRHAVAERPRAGEAGGVGPGDVRGAGPQERQQREPRDPVIAAGPGALPILALHGPLDATAVDGNLDLFLYDQDGRRLLAQSATPEDVENVRSSTFTGTRVFLKVDRGHECFPRRAGIVY